VQEGNIERVQPLEQFHNTSEIAQVPPIMCNGLLQHFTSIYPQSCFWFAHSQFRYYVCTNEHKFSLRQDEHKFPLCPCSSSRSVYNRI